MSDTTITTRWAPRRHTVRSEALTSPNSIRAYRSSPEDVTLQIRLNKDYVSVALSFDEARAIAAVIMAAVEG